MGGIPYYLKMIDPRLSLAFIEKTKTRKSVKLVFVTSSVLLRNMYSGRVQAEVTLDDLFV